MSFCGYIPQVRPDVVVVIGETSDITARDLEWTAWGTPTATATGTATGAYSDCHTGSYGAVPIRPIGSEIAPCAGKTRAYSWLRYMFTDSPSWGRVPASLNTSLPTSIVVRACWPRCPPG